MLRHAVVAGALLLCASPALADPWKSESGNDPYFEEYDRPGPGWHDDYDDWNGDGPSGVYEAPDYGIPDGYSPPPGGCRVWFDDLPPGEQPPPMSCWRARRYAERYGGDLVWGGDEY